MGHYWANQIGPDVTTLVVTGGAAGAVPQSVGTGGRQREKEACGSVDRERVCVEERIEERERVCGEKN